MKTIDLGTTYDSISPAMAGDGKKTKHYPSLSSTGADAEDVPSTGTATIKYRIRRTDAGADGQKPSVDLEVRSITFDGDGKGAKPKAKSATADYLANALKGAQMEDGSGQAPMGAGEGDEEAGESPDEESSEDEGDEES